MKGQASLCRAALVAFASLGVGNASKRGFGGSVDCAVHEMYSTDDKVAWYYNWGMNAPSEYVTNSCNLPPDKMLRFVPNLKKASWVNDADRLREFLNSYPADMRSRIPGIIGIIEPEKEKNAISPADAVAHYAIWYPVVKEYGLRLGSPSPASNAAGVAWFTEFLRLCDADAFCDYDFGVAHDFTCSLTNFKADLHPWLEWARNRGKKLWVNAFACRAYASWQWYMMDPSFTQEQKLERASIKQHKFMTAATNWMDRHDDIEAYAWYKASSTEVPEPDFGPTNYLFEHENNFAPTKLGIHYSK